MLYFFIAIKSISILRQKFNLKMSIFKTFAQAEKYPYVSIEIRNTLFFVNANIVLKLHIHKISNKKTLIKHLSLLVLGNEPLMNLSKQSKVFKSKLGCS